MKVKIAHVLYGGLGGHFNVLKNMVESDLEGIFDISVIFYGIELPRDEYLKFCRDNNLSQCYVKKTRGLDFTFVRRLSQEMIRMKSDFLFLHSSYPILSAIKAKKELDNLRIVIRETQAIHLKSKKEIQHTKLGLRHADKIVFLSEEYAAETLQQNDELNPNLETVVIPNGIEIPEKNSYQIRNNEIRVIGMLSRIVKIKDHETLIKAIAKLKKSGNPVRLKIAGDGEHLESLKKLVDKLGLQHEVLFSGIINPNQINNFLAELDVYIHATFGETMSNSIMQAQAFGLPIIASNVNGVNNVIQHEINGLLVEVEDVQAHVKAIQTLVADQNLLNRLSEASFHYAKEHLSRQKMFLSYQKLLS